MSSGLGESVRRAVLWRSGSQIFSQLVAWGSTLAVIRILNPADYGLFAMAEVVLVFLMFLNGYGFAGSLVKDEEVTETKLRQAFGLLLLVNCTLAILQVVIAPLAAAYYRQPIVADLLRTQALIFLATPFIALPEVMLMRQMDFRTQAIVNIAATVVSAAVALGCALSGYGVWTLIYAPIALFWTKAVGLLLATRMLVRPSFRFAGAGAMFNFGLAMILVQLCWIVMTKADAFLAARRLTAHELGLYSEAFFLISLLATKFVPPLNDVAFPAYARLQHDREALGGAFLKAVRLILLLTCPLYFGLAVVAPDAISVVLGDKWVPMAGLVTILGFAMPALTLHILFAPAINATGRVGISMRASVFGAVVMPIAFYVGLQWGASGLAFAWLATVPLLPIFTFVMARKLLHLKLRAFVAAIAPGLLCAAVMAIAVRELGERLAGLAPWERLLTEVTFGGLVYLAILLLTSRETVRELYSMVVRRKPPTPSVA
ncbi:oligosaccharide flippase family protein [Altererythrobacter salegens]|uniref:Oligosaccharide flippase family protein n=1 Tax=Croceibacterium salegens TaxID=1737568 RepID=A0A6I4SRI2_9SPHN|nr:lipopolysaccharide biosynthesis protein [Croceibacterium salegens]MXO58494.1 oligosaccharide flippase family protein [Croceibacterium salegens]